MVVHRTALWILLVVCSIAGGVYALVAELRAAGPDRSRAPIERYLFGTRTGVGIGISVAALVFLAAALIVKLEP